MINQTSQVVELANKINPGFGCIVLWGLLIIYAVLILIPGVLLLRLSRSLTPPKSEDAPEYGAYLEALKRRLASNPCLKGLDLSDRQQIKNALAILAKNADKIIHQTAGNVFISTAISQSGRLDAFLVLSALSRMVWQIARLYYQRPMLRDLIRLYANVAGTAFECMRGYVKEAGNSILSEAGLRKTKEVPCVEFDATTGMKARLPDSEAAKIKHK